MDIKFGQIENWVQHNAPVDIDEHVVAVMISSFVSQMEEDEEEKPIFFDDALKILGWQGGTIHQVLEVLRLAKHVVFSRRWADASGDYDEFNNAVASLDYSITR